jgi:hypothetical protein
VNIFSRFSTAVIKQINSLSGKASAAFQRGRRSSSPLADRLLADALRLVEIPSPTHQEEQRAAFILERLSAIGINNPHIDGEGNILVQILCGRGGGGENLPPLLLFSDMGSARWHPLDSLSRLDEASARGAGLADILGCAALLSAAEALTDGRLTSSRDVRLLFAVRSLDDPSGRAFSGVPPGDLAAAIGLRGLTLGSVIIHTRGIYRIRVTVSLARNWEARAKLPPVDAGTADDGAMSALSAGGEDPEHANLVVDTLSSVARRLSGITWDAQGATRFYMRRIEAGAGFGRVPAEGILEVELESSDATLLEVAMNAVKATVDKAGADNKYLRTEAEITSFIPVGDLAVNTELIKTIKAGMKELRIRFKEENGADPSAYLANQGIPSLSLGIALGWEGLAQDTIDIDSIERGRQLVETLIARL